MNSRCAAAIVTVYALFGQPCFAQEESLPVVGSVTARMPYGERIYNVYPMASNVKVSPEQWQFRYLPLFLPEVDKTGALVIDSQPNGDGWVVSVRFWLDNSPARAAGFKAVKAAYPSVAPRLLEANVGVIPVSEVKATVAHPKGKFVSESFNPGADPVFLVTIPAKSKDEAGVIAEWLRSPQGVIRCEYKYGTRSLKENSCTVTMTHLANTRVQKKLDGLPKDNGMVYVHRDSFSRLVEGVQSEFAGVDWVEDPTTFDTSGVEGLVALWNKQAAVDLSKWDEWKQKSTFDPADLSPDRITRDFRKSFTYDAGTKQYKLNVSGEAGVRIGPFGGSAKASYSKEELETFLRQHSLEVELDGEQIRPKKVWLQVVDTADFSRNIVIANRRLFVGGKETQTEVIDVRPGQAVRDKAVQKDLEGRLADLASAVKSIDGRTLSIKAIPVLLVGEGGGAVKFPVDAAKATAGKPPFGEWHVVNVAVGGTSSVLKLELPAGSQVLGGWFTPIRYATVGELKRWGFISVVPDGDKAMVNASTSVDNGHLEGIAYVLYASKDK